MQKHTLIDYPEIMLDPIKQETELDFVDIFGRSAPVHVEIGSGKGAFLLSQARLHPEINYLGIEWARKYYRFCVDRFGRWGITNIRMVRDDATVFLERHIPDSSISCFHVYYPDPWPKKHHHKRRFFAPKTIPDIYRCLIHGGNVCFVTDNREYFKDAIGEFSRQHEYWEKKDFIPTDGTKGNELVGTNYEKKYHKEGRSVYAVEYRKIQLMAVTQTHSCLLLNEAGKSTDNIHHQLQI